MYLQYGMIKKESLFSYCGISYRNYAFYLSKKHTINMGYSFFWKFIEDSFKNVYVELESLLFARPIYNNVQIKEKSPPFWIRNKNTHTHTHTHTYI